MSDYKVEDGLYYTDKHEWVKIDGDTAIVGITDCAQQLLTDIVFVELPDLGKELKQFDTSCVVESVKSVSDIYTPLGGKVSEVNSELESTPEAVNQDAYGEGWMFKLTGFNADETANLMDPEAYKEFCAKEAH